MCHWFLFVPFSNCFSFFLRLACNASFKFCHYASVVKAELVCSPSHNSLSFVCNICFKVVSVRQLLIYWLVKVERSPKGKEQPLKSSSLLVRIHQQMVLHLLLASKCSLHSRDIFMTHRKKLFKSNSHFDMYCYFVK